MVKAYGDLKLINTDRMIRQFRYSVGQCSLIANKWNPLIVRNKLSARSARKFRSLLQLKIIFVAKLLLLTTSSAF